MNIFFQAAGCFFMNYISSLICKKNAEKYLENPYTPIYDIIHNNVPKIGIHTPEYLLLVSFVSAIIKQFFSPGSDEQLQINISAVGYSLVLRSITTISTIMPTCMPRPPSSQSYYKKIFLSTHDLMYSGHTIIFIFLGTMVDADYCTNMFLYSYSRMIQFVFPISLILSRQHYTNDVIVSIVVYNLFYHLLALPSISTSIYYRSQCKIRM